ncbi:unnamed protein product [Polarella glacialis]|uniref:Mannosyltransferase n=1 Tax=Polarella glacialis TaxID=89957 RepID=A0A813D0F2_POLGL|nr:unnamed protein product [Polarella glacialis]
MSELRQRKGATSDAAEVGGSEEPRGLEHHSEEKSSFSFCSLGLPLLVLLGARILAAAISPIADCDETFNYWEPAHFLAFGRGFQTWEYSPVYALRSYLFLLPHSCVAWLAAQVAGRPLAFFLTRGAQALFAVAAECCFVVAVGRRIGWEVAATTAWLLAVSPGSFVAAVAFLPSSLAMLQVCVSWSLWLSGRHSWAIFVGAGTVVVIWPFAGLLFVPLGLHALVRSPCRAMAAAVASFLLWAGLSMSVDSFFYGRTVLPAFEIFRYNVLDRSKSGGSELYGVESWDFYLRNGLLNLTVALPVAALLPVAAVLECACSRARTTPGRSQAVVALGFTLPGFIWLGFFSAIPHKEERFLAPAYPLLLLAAAATVHSVSAALAAAARRFVPPAARLFALLPGVFVLVSLAASASRIAAVQSGYGAPVDIYKAMSKELGELRSARGPSAIGPLHVCVGGEWHRFMTSFFLPHEDDHFSYIRFGPTGLLPAEFNASLGTSGIPPHMNDLNQEETTRYIDPKLCDFLVDLDLGDSQTETALTDLRHKAAKQSNVVAEFPFLDAARSRFPWRAFYFPFKSEKQNRYGKYSLKALSPQP